MSAPRRSKRTRRFAATLLVSSMACAVIGATTARADTPLADGVYGRFDGDVMFATGAGGGARLTAGTAAGALTGELRARFLDAVGPFLAVEVAPAQSARVLVGVELRPLFPMLFLMNMSFNDAWLDLFVQSLAVELGTALGPLDDRFGSALLVGFAVELPVVLPSVLGQGLFLRLTGRHATSAPEAIGGPNGGVSDWFCGALLVVRWSGVSGLVKREPPRYQPRPR